MNDYQIIREIGKGGMGCVFEATDEHGQRVALKMMSAKAASQPDYRDLFEHEVESLRILDSPSVVRIVGSPFSDASGNLFLPMEYVEGRTLAQVVKQEGPFPEKRALELFGKVLDAFSYIHSRHCIHRDVKPSNIMLRSDDTICVIDFGIAKDSKTSTGKTIGRIVGTDGYMSPEQANGYNIDTRTDIYSLGCLLHFMLTGVHAIQKKSNEYETICAILESTFPKVSDYGVQVSDNTQQAIFKAVDKNMMHRYQTAQEFKMALLPEASGGTGMDSTYRITVGRSGCDINMPSEYISGKHLDIICRNTQAAPSPETWLFTIVDHSTNGTGVNGRKIHRESYEFTVPYSVHQLLQNPSLLPPVMIAGLPQHALDWHAVMQILYERAGLGTVIVIEDPENHFGKQVNGQTIATGGGTNTSGRTMDNTHIDIPLVILSFLLPPVGCVLGFVWRDEAPYKSKAAFKLALFGLLFIVILLLVIDSMM